MQATIVGTDGDDRLTGTDGDDVIVGLDGGDDIRALGGNDSVCSGDNTTIPGGVGEGSGMDEVDGGGGDDWIDGGPGTGGGSVSSMADRVTTR